MAEAQEGVVDVTPVRLPVTEPLIEAVSRSGAEIREIFFAEPVPAVIFKETNPTGSVVAFSASAAKIMAANARVKKWKANFI